MFGHAFFGAAFFGAAFFGPAAAGGPTAIETAGLTGSVTTLPRSNSLALASTNTITLHGLRNDTTKAYPLDATVVLTAILDSSSIPVARTQNIPMPYISGVGRKSMYRCATPHTVVFTPGTYTVRVTATDASGNVRVFDRTCTTSSQ